MLRRTTYFSVGLERSAASLVTALVIAFGFGCSSAGTEVGVGEVDAGTDSSGTGCPKGTELCGDTCVATSSDPNNCGKCGVTCVDGEVCGGDKGCGLTCPAGTSKCDKSCFALDNDPKNCGACGTACADGEACVAGKCTGSCATPLTNCSGKCTDTAYDPENCGACGTKCAVGVACIGGGCGTADTTDDDGDTISNFHEGKGSSVDTDGDGKPDSTDDDSDGDGILDKDEAGDTNPVTPPADTDGDLIPDFRDTDSDNDGLSDADEKTKYGTSPTKPDTDGDGYTDFEEVSAGTDPKVATSNPGVIGGFSFDLPYKGLPRSQDLTFQPSISKADVAFITDTTGSMGSVISNIRTELKNIATALTTDTSIKDPAFGVGDYKDFTISPYGGTGDFSFLLRQRMTTLLTDAQSAVDKYLATGGGDIPEATIEAMYQAATGVGFTSPGGTVAVFNPDTGYDATKGHGKIGGMGFRKDAAPFFIVTTDAQMHVAGGDAFPTGVTVSGTLAYDNTKFTGSKPVTISATIAAMKGIGARVIGLGTPVTTGGTVATGVISQLRYFSLQTDAYIPATGGGTTCPTGIGTPVTDPKDPTKKVCPLTYSTAAGSVATSVVDAIKSFTKFVSFKTVWLEARDNTTTTTVDETKFFVRGVPVSYSGDTTPCGGKAPTIADLLPTSTPDGSFDSFKDVCPGLKTTFSLQLQNTTVPATCTDQVFAFRVVVIGDGDIGPGVDADSRIVTVRVPGDKSLCK